MKKKLTQNEQLLHEAARHQERDLFDFARNYSSYLKRLRKGDPDALMQMRLLRLSVLLAEARYDELGREAQTLQRYFSKRNDEVQAARAMNYHARALIHTGKPDKALQFQMKVLNILSAYPGHAFHRNAQHTLSDIFNALGFFEQALNVLLDQLGIARQQQNASGELVLLSQVATVCMDMQQFAEADVYLKEAEHLLQTAAIPMPFPVTVHRTRALWLLHHNKVKQALTLVKTKIEPHCHHLPAVKAAVYSLIAKCHSRLHKKEEALSAVEQSIRVAADNGLHVHSYSAHMDAAKYHLEAGNVKAASTALTKVAAAISSSGSAKFQQQWHEAMEQVALAKGDTREAYEHLRKSADLRHAQQLATAELRLSAIKLLTREKYRAIEMQQLQAELADKRGELEKSALYLKQHQAVISELDSFVNTLRKDHNRQRTIIKKVHDKIRGLQLHDSEKQQIEQKLNVRQRDFITRIRKRHPLLSFTEARICFLLQQGMSSKEISSLLVIDLHTVEQHRYRIRRKLGIAKQQTLPEYLAGI